ncbi:5400_t:CDS:1, partial [Racocetra persica]
ENKKNTMAQDQIVRTTVTEHRATKRPTEDVPLIVTLPSKFRSHASSSREPFRSVQESFNTKDVK